MMRPRPWMAAPVVVALALGATGLVQQRLDRMRTAEFDDELLYLPNDKLLAHFTAGAGGVVADLLWLKCIQYTSRHFQGDHKYTWLAHMTDMITRLDPYYVDVYRYGGMFLASLQADDGASIALMKRGYLKNPQAWELPYEIAMVYLLNRRESPESVEMAIRYLHMSVATGQAHDGVLEILQGLQRRHSLFDLEHKIWTDLRDNSPDKLMRDLAERKLDELLVRRCVEALQSAADRWTRDTGAAPARMEDLVASGLIDAVPEDPLGGRYFLEPDGTVRNTSLLDAQTQRSRDVLRGQVDTFVRELGRLPTTLEEMVDLKVVSGLPAHPYSGRQWTYDPATGAVE